MKLNLDLNLKPYLELNLILNLELNLKLNLEPNIKFVWIPQPIVCRFKFAECSLHIVVCILQFAHCSLHITVCLNLNFESETECGIESETESGTQYQIYVDSMTKNPISN